MTDRESALPPFVDTTTEFGSKLADEVNTAMDKEQIRHEWAGLVTAVTACTVAFVVGSRMVDALRVGGPNG
jgi:hypothetical protein